ncbi:hypothetical protein M23134_06872 [Microscilla marina ATCC 23134]|uniref:Uncharacterized protein n=1 Tax=Microscilla marina ATCC 23134 TaxID=313606 RepID=A1ZQ62_MICM2|nr:hypothetical protein M23134_06872 [Microscilla marina ATCC 23134]
MPVFFSSLPKIPHKPSLSSQNNVFFNTFFFTHLSGKFNQFKLQITFVELM